MFRAATDGLARRGRCTPGDKTILDTLAPAAVALEHAVAVGAGLRRRVGAALRAGARGMRSTRPLVARRGLALRLGTAPSDISTRVPCRCLLLLRALGDA